MMDKSANRRTLIATSALAALGLNARHARAHEEGTPAAATLPDTPAGRQLAWMLDLINGDDPLPDIDGIAERFSPSLLAVLPASDLIETLGQIRTGFAPIEIIEILSPQTPYLLVVIATTRVGNAIEVTISVEREEPHLIEGLLFAPYSEESVASPVITTWSDLDTALTTENGKYGIDAAQANGGSWQPVHQTNHDEPFAVASVCKLYVLGALAEEINAGNMNWSDQIELTAERLSLPGGITQDESIGSMFTVEELALRMISISDNTATDLLFHALGRDKVESALITLGNSVPGLNRPFLTTREMFIIKFGDEADRSAYATADEVTRRDILAELINAPLPDDSVADDWTSPRNLDTIEWFATMEDVSQALLWLHSAWQRPGLEPLKTVLTTSAGVPVDPDVFPVVAFKGGSEPGVMALAWLLERNDGKVFTLSVAINDPVEMVDENAIALVMAGALTLLTQ